MPVATRIPRYNKYQKIYIDGNEQTLIEHLRLLREKHKITKKRISNIIKQNDTWYSQIERNGKNGDDHRQKTIYRPDLINIISIVNYGANSISELEQFQNQSAVYIDKIIKAVPVEEAPNTLEWYQINNQRTPSEQDALFNSLIASINKSIKQTYANSSHEEKDTFLDCLKEMNASLKIDACFMISLLGLPFSEFLYEADQNRIDALFQDVLKTMDQISIPEDKTKSSLDNKYYLDLIYQSIEKYINISKIVRRNKFDLLPPDKMTW